MSFRGTREVLGGGGTGSNRRPSDFQWLVLLTKSVAHVEMTCLHRSQGCQHPAPLDYAIVLPLRG